MTVIRLARAALKLLPFLPLMACSLAASGHFADLGIPVRTAGVRAFTTGPGAAGRRDCLYVSCNQDGGPAFLMQVDLAAGTSRQFAFPRGESNDSNLGAWACLAASDGKIYLGTYSGGNLLVFDPKKPDDGITFLGRPARTESFIWDLAEGADHRVYGVTYPHARLIRYEPKTGAMSDLGRLDPKEMYARRICADGEGWLYIGIGSVRGQIVAFNPATDERRPLIPESERPAGIAQVYHDAVDGNAYAAAGSAHYRLAHGTATKVDAAAIPPMPHQNDRPLDDGRWVATVSEEGNYTLLDPATGGKSEHHFTYEGAGTNVFVVANGPDGRIYGSSILPLRLFVFDPVAGTHRELGVPVDADGEIYSFATLGHELFMSAYPGAMMGRYDPSRPFRPGYAATDNPFKVKNRLGDGHLRPRAMVVGPDHKLYVGSYPPYGEWGGAMAVVDPATLQAVENYRNLIADQSICALAYDEHTGLVFGGSAIAGGLGTKPRAATARLFAWNARKKKLEFEIEPLAGETAIVALCVAHNQVILAGGTKGLAVFDLATRTVVHRAPLPFGQPVALALGRHPNGLVYGLTHDAVYSIDPATFDVREVARPPVTINSGFALSDDGIYFGSGVHLWHYAFSAPDLPAPQTRSGKKSPGRAATSGD